MKKKGPTGSSASSSPETPIPEIGSYNPSVSLFVAIALLIYLGQAEGCYHHGLFSATVYEPYADLRSIPNVGGEVNRVEAGREIYARVCSACHQPNGMGNPANGCPPLAGSDWVLAEGPARIIRLVLHGGIGEITVNNQKWNGAGMLAFKDTLSDDEIANVLTFIRRSPDWKNSAAEVTPEMVKTVREATATRTRQFTPDELLKVPVTE